ncbi:MAG: VOC family protein [Bacteroidota bacterium]
MKAISPYLFFPGNCEEALHFYEHALSGTISSIQRFGDAEMPVEEDYKQKIMHAELSVGDLSLMFSDGAPHKELVKGNTMYLSLEMDSVEEQDQVFERLSDQGSVIMELQDTFWGARFGQVEDRFGIRWMLNIQLST